MTKYKLNNTTRSTAGVTLTSYMLGNLESASKRDEPLTDPLRDPLPDPNQNDPPADNKHTTYYSHEEKRSRFYPPEDRQSRFYTTEESRSNIVSSEERSRREGLAASLVKHECNRFGLNELRVDTLGKDVCLCEKYNGGCKLCPRAHRPANNGVNTVAHGGGANVAHGEGKDSCPSCQGPTSISTPYANNAKHGLNVQASGGGVGGGGGDRYPVKPGSSREGWGGRLTRRLKSFCTHKNLVRRLPVLGWLPGYTLQKGLSDMIAGITVGLTVIPQAIAYAGVAGLPPQYGLYSSFMACFVYTIFGSVKDSAIGPTAIAAILTRENLHGLGPEFAVLLCFLSGCVELLMGLLQLGFLIDFISGPVSVGFTSAAAIIIATTQVKDILGLSFPGGKFLQVWSGLYEHAAETRLWDAALGAACIAALLLLRKVKDIKVAETSGWRRMLSRSLWLLATTRNILVVLFCASLAYYFDTKQQTPFRLTGEVKSGLPQFGAPPFSAVVGNHTYTFIEMASTLGSAVFVVPLLSILENIALAKVFSEGKPVDATQEMVALGLCNVAASLVESMPVSGALSRGAVNHASGVRTPAGGLYTGALVLLALQYLTPYFYYIPKASLAAVIIAAVVFMMELHVFKPIWRTKKLDIIPAGVTLVSCLVTRLELGIVIGIAVNLAFLLYAAARPDIKLTTETSASGVVYSRVCVGGALRFPAAERARAACRRAAARGTPVVLAGDLLTAADYTAAKGIQALIEDFHARGQSVILYRMKPSILEVFRGVRPRELLHAATSEELDVMLQQIITKQMHQQP